MGWAAHSGISGAVGFSSALRIRPFSEAFRICATASVVLPLDHVEFSDSGSSTDLTVAHSYSRRGRPARNRRPSVTWGQKTPTSAELRY